MYWIPAGFYPRLKGGGRNDNIADFIQFCKGLTICLLLREGYNTLSMRTITIIGIFILSPILLLGCAGSSVTTIDAKSNARAQEDMGVSLVRQGNLRGGLEHLLKAIELDPKNPDLNHELAIVYRT